MLYAVKEVTNIHLGTYWHCVPRGRLWTPPKSFVFVPFLDVCSILQSDPVWRQQTDHLSAVHAEPHLLHITWTPAIRGQGAQAMEGQKQKDGESLSEIFYKAANLKRKHNVQHEWQSSIWWIRQWATVRTFSPTDLIATYPISFFSCAGACVERGNYVLPPTWVGLNYWWPDRPSVNESASKDLWENLDGPFRTNIFHGKYDFVQNATTKMTLVLISVALEPSPADCGWETRSALHWSPDWVYSEQAQVQNRKYDITQNLPLLFTSYPGMDYWRVLDWPRPVCWDRTQLTPEPKEDKCDRK